MSLQSCLSTLLQQSSMFMFCSFDSWCWMEDASQRRRREENGENWSVWWVLRSVRADLNSNTDEHPRCESSLASLRLIWSKVIRLLGRDQHCGRTCCAALNNCGGFQIKGGLISYKPSERVGTFQFYTKTCLYKDVGGQGGQKKKCQISSSALSVSLLQVYICFTSFRLSAASKFQFWNRAMRSVRCRQLQLAVQVDDHKLPVSLRAATGFSSSAETKFSLFFLLNWIITTFIREVRFLVCLCHY